MILSFVVPVSASRKFIYLSGKVFGDSDSYISGGVSVLFEYLHGCSVATVMTDAF
jgi:hypothetical protein